MAAAAISAIADQYTTLVRDAVRSVVETTIAATPGMRELNIVDRCPGAFPIQLDYYYYRRNSSSALIEKLGKQHIGPILGRLRLDEKDPLGSVRYVYITDVSVKSPQGEHLRQLSDQGYDPLVHLHICVRLVTVCCPPVT